MTASLLYRLAAVLLVLYAAGHTIGFRHIDPRWGLDVFINGLRATRFTVQGAERDFWGFYVGFGFFCTVLLLFSAIAAWQLGALPLTILERMPLLTWGFALTFFGATIITGRYFFAAPTVFSTLVTICLAGAAWLSRGAL